MKIFAEDKLNMAEMISFVTEHSWKRRKCWLSSFYPFPTIFLKRFFVMVFKSWDCVVKAIEGLLMKYIGRRSNHKRHIILVTEIIMQFIPRSLSIRKELFDM